jgi:glycosyltransferase involved in cell wall biosynthesis
MENNLKTILFLTHENLKKTAVSKAMFEDIAHVLQLEGYKVSIFSAGEKKNIYVKDNVCYFTFKRSSYEKVNFSAFFSILASYIMFIKLLLKCEIFYFRSYPTMILFSWLPRLLGKKNIFDTRGLFFDELYDSGKISNYKFKKIMVLIERLLLRLSHKVITVTESQAKYYLSILPSISHKLVTVPNGAPIKKVDTSMFDSKRLELVYVGSLVKWHTPELVLNFCLELKRREVDLRLTVLTRDLSKAEKHFLELGKDVNIYEHDYRNKPIRFHYGFCFISGGLSKDVCFPVKFLEYIQSGTKVVSSSNVDVTKKLTYSHNLGVCVDLSESVSEMVDRFLEYDYEKRQRIVSLPSHLTFEAQCDMIKKIVSST